NVATTQPEIFIAGPTELATPSLSDCHTHSFSTRLLYSVMPANWYAANDASIVAGETKHFFAVMAGAKGDWPWLRKSFGLQVGFTSTRVCHLCPSEVPWPLVVFVCACTTEALGFKKCCLCLLQKLNLFSRYPFWPYAELS
ncbi:unnamed protein product, partial [Effrenium voratum]